MSFVVVERGSVITAALRAHSDEARRYDRFTGWTPRYRDG